MTASLYIHIPFCGSLCDYCDFFSVPVSESGDAVLMDSYISAVLNDVGEQLAFFNVEYVPTVYIGGGTPSVLGAGRMSRLLAGIQDTVALRGSSAPAEFTVEANPESADESFLAACTGGGVNRISLGVQSFHEPSRLALGRRTGKTLEKQLALAAEYFPGAFSADIITGLPFQTESVLLGDIERLLAFQPAHVSLYSLILEPQTPLGRRVSRLGAAALSLPPDDDADKLWITGRDILENAGLAQYEVSNFSLPLRACAHNIRYWRMENWLGAGAAASGTIISDETGKGRRFTYPADIGAYLASPQPSARIEELNQADLVRESLLMGFRYRKGPDPHSFKRRFGRSIEDCIPQTISRWHMRGFFETEDPECLAPSREGLLFLNGFLRDAFEELAACNIE